MNSARLQRQQRRGLPATALRDRRLMFDTRTDSVVFWCSIEQDGGIVSALYVRGLASGRYEPLAPVLTQAVGSVQGHLTFEWPVLCLDSTLFTVACEVGMSVPVPDRGRATALRQIGVVRLDLAARTAALWPTDGWFVSDLLSASEDRIVAVVGFPPGEGRVRYALCELCWGSRKITELGEFEDIFF